MKTVYMFLTLLFLSACGGDSDSSVSENDDVKANVTEITVQGSQNNYIFNVTLESDDTGCQQYADWWEILTEDGQLIYRRILGHSHTTEQPFTRSGGPIEIIEDSIVYIRAHMNTQGYIGDVFKGSVQNGFIKSNNTPKFASEIEEELPLSDGCAF